MALCPPLDHRPQHHMPGVGPPLLCLPWALSHIAPASQINHLCLSPGLGVSVGEFKIKHHAKAVCGALPPEGAGSTLTSICHCHHLLGTLGENKREDRLCQITQLMKAGTVESGDEAGQEQLNNYAASILFAARYDIQHLGEMRSTKSPPPPQRAVRGRWTHARVLGCLDSVVKPLPFPSDICRAHSTGALRFGD